MSACGRLVLYCSNGKYGWYMESCPLLGRCPLLGMSIIRGSTVFIMYMYFLLLILRFFMFVPLSLPTRCGCTVSLC